MKALAGPSLIILTDPCCGLSLIREGTGPCHEGLLPLLQVRLYAAPVVKLRYRQPEDINSFLFIKSGALIFLSLVSCIAGQAQHKLVSMDSTEGTQLTCEPLFDMFEMEGKVLPFSRMRFFHPAFQISLLGKKRWSMLK